MSRRFEGTLSFPGVAFARVEVLDRPLRFCPSDTTGVEG